MTRSKRPKIDKLRKKGDVPGLVEALRHEEPEVRGGAAVALGQLADTAAVEPLIAALADEDRGVRKGAASALGHLGDGHAVDPLIAALSDEHYEVRVHAAMALGDLGDARAVEPLTVNLTNDISWDVRAFAARALEALGDARAGEPLIDALGDEEAMVRGHAAQALRALGDARAVEPLSAALSKETPTDVPISSLGGDTVAQSMARALESLGVPAARIEELKEQARSGQEPPKAVDMLKTILTDHVSPQRDPERDKDLAERLERLFDEPVAGDRAAEEPVAGDQAAEWSEQGAEWRGEQLRCPKCGAMLNERTPRYGFVRCGECGAPFEVRDYEIQAR